MKDNKRLLLIVGEAGIGKTALLDEVYKRLRAEEDDNNNKQRNTTFVGYYSKTESLVAESPSFMYPFVIVLANLLKEAKESLKFGEKIESTITRIKKASVGFGKKEIEKIAGAILEDAVKKAGFEQTFKITKQTFLAFWSRFTAQTTSLMSAEDFVAKNIDQQALQAWEYLELLLKSSAE